MQVLIRLFFAFCCMLPMLSFSADIDSLVLEKIKAKIERKIDLQIAQNQANDRLGQGHLNNYVIDCGRLLQDADETDYFKIKEANNGKTLWSLGSAAFEEEGRGIKAILNSLNNSRQDNDKIYLVLISIYDYNRDIIAWHNYKESGGKIENYQAVQAVDKLTDMDWSTANNEVRTKQPLSEKEVEKLYNDVRPETPLKNNINGKFVEAIIKQKIGTGEGFSSKTIACFSHYQIQFDSTQRSIYKIHTSIYRYTSIPQRLEQLIDNTTEAYDLQGAGRNEALREIVSILAEYERCNGKSDPAYIAEAQKISRFLDDEMKKLPSGVKSGIFVTKQSSEGFFDFWTTKVNKDKFEDIEWKIRHLEKKTGYKICVVVDNSTIDICDNLLADSVFSMSTMLDKSKTILVYARLTSRQFSLQAFGTVYKANIGVHFSEELQSYLKQSVSYQPELYSQSDVEGFVGLIEKYVREQIYRPLPKPATKYSYYMNYKGDIVELEPQDEPSVSGREYMYEMVLVEDSRTQKYIDTFRSLLNTSGNKSHYFLSDRTFLEVFEVGQGKQPGTGWTPEQAEYFGTLFKIEREEATNWTPIAHGLKESAMANEEIRKRYIAWYRRDRFSQLAITYQFISIAKEEIINLPDNIFVNGKNEIGYQKAIEAFDELSLLLSSTGADIFVDGLGFVYAAYYGDVGTAAGFAVGAIPLLGNGLKKFMQGSMRAVVDVRAKKFILKEFGQAVSDFFRLSRKTVVSEFSLKGIGDIGDVLLKKDDNIIDLIVHYKDGKYWAYIEKEGKFIREGFDEADFAAFIKQKIPDDGSAIRLLSCSDLESAKEFSKLFPDRGIYAIEDIVRVHADGGITTIAQGTESQSWKRIKNGVEIGDAPTPKTPQGEAVGKWVQMGGGKVKLARVDEIKSYITTEEGAQSLKNIEDIQKRINEGDIFIWSRPIYTTTINDVTYVLDGHNRLMAVVRMNYTQSVNIIELTKEEAVSMFESKMEEILSGYFKKTLYDDIPK
jgi:hypothetical protein